MATHSDHDRVESVFVAEVAGSGYDREKLAADLLATEERADLLRAVLAAHPETRRLRREQTAAATLVLLNVSPVNAAFVQKFAAARGMHVRAAARYAEYDCCIFSEVQVQFGWRPSPDTDPAAPDRSVILQIITGRKLCTGRVWRTGARSKYYAWDARSKATTNLVVAELRTWAAGIFGLPDGGPDAAFVSLLRYARTDLTVLWLNHLLAPFPDVAWPHAFDTIGRAK